MKRAIVLGKGSLAIRIAEWFRASDAHDLALVVPVVPEPPWTDSLAEWCDRIGQAWVGSGRHEDAEGVYDLAVSVTYSHILPESFIARCDRAINIHNSPLPRYRGTSPINWALKNGERVHGVTIHEITPRVDQGPIIAQVLFPIWPEIDEVRDVYARCLAFGWTLFTEVMPLLDSLTAWPQNESHATYHTRAQSALLGERVSWTRAESLAGS